VEETTAVSFEGEFRYLSVRFHLGAKCENFSKTPSDPLRPSVKVEDLILLFFLFI
jgi:hypothetical protein